jgi:alkanesulfonate monooxygenase SsuD/methylene tetrahydromethanopterin reductase-like flavin-dependent oxidoreductase (luciferase family)
LREEFETIGQGWSTRGRRFDEMLDVMRDIWDDGYAEYHGQYYDFPTTAVFPVPSRQPDIWIGGSSQAAAERAARFEGYMPLDSVSDRSRAEFAMIDKIRADCGLSGQFERLVLGPTVPNVGDVRRLQETEGVTGIAMSPLLMWNESMALRTHEELRDVTQRYAEALIGQV